MLKSYRLTLKNKKRKKKRRGRLSDVGTLAVGGATAIIGLGFLGATTSAVSRV